MQRSRSVSSSTVLRPLAHHHSGCRRWGTALFQQMVPISRSAAAGASRHRWRRHGGAMTSRSSSRRISHPRRLDSLTRGQGVRAAAGQRVRARPPVAPTARPRGLLTLVPYPSPFQALPATPETICLYLADLAQRGRAVSTLPAVNPEETLRDLQDYALTARLCLPWPGLGAGPVCSTFE